MEIVSLRDDLSKRIDSAETKRLYEVIDRLKQQLNKVSENNANYIKAEKQLAETKNELFQAQQKISGTYSRLNFAEQTLRDTDARLSDTEKKLAATESELNALKKGVPYVPVHKFSTGNLAQLGRPTQPSVSVSPTSVDKEDISLIWKPSTSPTTQPPFSELPLDKEKKERQEKKEEQRIMRTVNKTSRGRFSAKDLADTDEKESDPSEPETTVSPRNADNTFIKLPTKKRKGKGALQAKLAAMHARTNEEKSKPVDMDAKRTEQEKFTLATDYIKEGNFDSFRLILQRIHNLDMIGEDEDKNTLLHWAAVCGQLKIAELLIEKGAKQVTNTNGETALELAQSGVEDQMEGYQAIVDLLSSHNQ